MTPKLLLPMLLIPVIAAGQGRDRSAGGPVPETANEELPRVLYIVPWQDTGEVSEEELMRALAPPEM